MLIVEKTAVPVRHILTHSVTGPAPSGPSASSSLCLSCIFLSTIACQYATYLLFVNFSVLVLNLVVSRVTILTSTVPPGLMAAESLL